MDIFNIAKGLCLLSYGIIKISFCICEFFKIKIPFTPNDDTQAGLIYLMFILIFSIYTLLHGFAIFNIGPNYLKRFFHYKNRSILMNTIFAIALALLSMIILFTDIPIEKDENKILIYELLGMCGSVLFFITGFISLLYLIYIEEGFSISFFCILFITLILIFILVHSALQFIKMDHNSIKHIISIIITTFTTLIN
jgi:hypothetical protein